MKLDSIRPLKVYIESHVAPSVKSDVLVSISEFFSVYFPKMQKSAKQNQI
jgi:hypothetical protein